MIRAEFEVYFKKRIKQDVIWNYTIATIITLLGLGFLYLLFFTNWYDIKLDDGGDEILPKNVLLVFFFIITLLGIYGYWKVPYLNKFTIIDCLRNRVENQKLIESVARDFKMFLIHMENGYFQYRYLGRFLNPFDVHFFVDEKQCLLINVQHAGWDGGYIDFGLNNKVKFKIINQIVLTIKPK